MIMLSELISTQSHFKDEEYFGKYHASFEFSGSVELLDNLIKQIFDTISERDELEIFIRSENLDEGYTLSQYSQNTILEFYSDNLIEIDELIIVTLEVRKQLINQTLSIYSFETFQSKICSLPLLDILKNISDYFQVSKNRLIFEVRHDNFSEFSTEYISFLPVQMSDSVATSDRRMKLSRTEYLSRFFNISEYRLLPEDFRLINMEQENQIITLFDKIVTMLSILYIGYESSIESENIIIQISHDKIQKLTVPIHEIEYNPAIVDLYKWIVADDNYLDKAMITRNVLSLNLKNEFSIGSEIIDLSQKTYNVAIKEKIEKYFAVKSETAEFITATLHELSQIKITIVERFLYNIVAVGIFLATTLLPTILEEKKIESIFTPDVNKIIRITMVCSVIYCILTNVKNYFVLQAYEKTLDKLKNNFEEYYSVKELETVFNVKNLSDIKKGIIIWSGGISLLWIGISVIGFFWFK